MKDFFLLFTNYKLFFEVTISTDELIVKCLSSIGKRGYWSGLKYLIGSREDELAWVRIGS